MRERLGGSFLIGAAALFWIAWALMPGVGVTDAAEILARVGRERGAVMASAALQLASAACYAPALVALAIRASAERRRVLVVGAILLLVGAMGSAADAVFHWLAVEMTAPGVERDAMLPVMARMQGPGLAVVAPLLAAYFAGVWVAGWASLRARWIPISAFLLATAGPALAVSAAVIGLASARVSGLAFLACLAGAQAWLGAALFARPTDR